MYFFGGEICCRHKSSDCFEYPKNLYLNQSTQENTRQIFLPKKIPESKLLNPKESFDHPHHLKSGETSPPWCTIQHGDHNGHSLECCRGQVLSLPLFFLFFLFCPFYLDIQLRRLVQPAALFEIEVYYFTLGHESPVDGYGRESHHFTISFQSVALFFGCFASHCQRAIGAKMLGW